MTLEELLDYEIRNSSRYRRFVSIVMVANGNGANVELKKILGEHVRNSDSYFEFKNASAILMGETDVSGSLKAVQRYKSNYSSDIDLRFAVASYPNDGQSTLEILDTLLRRSDDSKLGAPGEVVAQG